MNFFRLTALSVLGGVAILSGCASDASVSSSASSADTSSVIDVHAALPPMGAFEKRLKFSIVQPGLTFAGESQMRFQDEFAVAHPGYPAFKPNVPQVTSHGGVTLANPRIVTVTWDGDANRDVYEKFGDEIGETRYWRDNTAEYGVGKAISGAANHVHISPGITSIADDAVDDLVRQAIKNTVASGWPAPDSSTIYNVFLPPNALTFGSHNGCEFGIGGYHTDSLLDPNDDHGGEFLYAVNLNCPAKWDVHTMTAIASHEIVESVTDPFPQTHAAFVGFDDAHLAYDMYNQFQDEVGDACEFFKSSEYVGGSTFAFGLQRNWSNKSAAAGHDPCVPQNRLPYFNVTTFAEEMDSISIDLTSVGDQPHTTSGYKATVGETRNFGIGFYADAPTNADWTVWAKIPPTMPLTDDHGTKVPNGKGAVTIDSPAGHNGHKAQVSVTPSEFNALGVVYLELHSVLQGGEEKVVPIFLAGANPATPTPPPAPTTPPANPPTP
jgi:hypothetical protein